MNVSRALVICVICLAVGCSKPAERQATEPTDVQTSDQVESGPQSQHSDRRVVQLTDAAVIKLKEFLRDSPSSHIRVSILGDGSAGFSYSLTLDDELHDADYVDRSQGVTIAVDPSSALYVEGATIDWTTEPNGQTGFKFENPNAVSVGE